jgi:hypothetical protein
MTIMKTKPTQRSQLWHRIRGAVDGYGAEIVRLIGECYGTKTLEQAWWEFTLGDTQAFQFNDPHAELFFSWLFHRWAPEKEKGSEVDDSSLYGVPPTRAYLDRRSSRLHPLLRRYLELCLVTAPSFYEVSNCRPRIGFGARDVMSGRELLVNEELASTSLSNGVIMFAHLVKIDNTTMLEAISPLAFPQDAKERLQRLSRKYAGEPGDAPDLRGLYFALVQSALLRSSATMH